MVIAAILVLVAGCGNSAEVAGAPPAGTDLQGWLDYFEAEGALEQVSDEQLDVLQEAADAGELTYEDVVGLINLTFACVEEQGLAPTWQDPQTNYGYPVPFYAIAESDVLGSEASQAVIDGCTNRYSGLAEQLYLWQPVNAAIYEQHWDQEVRPAMVACLKDQGVDIDDSATRQEIEAEASALYQPTGPTDDPVFGVDCFSESGGY